MTVEFAIDFIPRRMRELGFSGDYVTRWRHFQIPRQGKLQVDADNEFFYLIAPSPDIRVHSKFGAYDITDPLINEMQYEHRGKINILSYSLEPLFVVFIQVIPTHKK